MMKPTYPSITDASLVPFRAIEAQLKQFPDILDREDCPYPPSVKTFLRKICGGPEVVGGPMSDDDLVAETSRLYREIQVSSRSIKGGDAKDTASIFKTMTDLLGKLVDMRGKAINVRQMSQFQKAVLTLLESVLTPAQRSEFVEIMGKWIEDVQ